MDNEKTPLSKLGEFGLINKLTKDIKLIHESSLTGVGDDAAIIDNGCSLTLVSTDLLVEGVHFDLTYTPLMHLGYKSAVVNFSDIYAMNGTPKQLLIGLAASNKFTVEDIEEFYMGIKMACEKYNVDLVGGDTTSSKAGLFLSLTIIGECEKGKEVKRSTANEGDLVCVSGNLGGAYMGLLVLQREKVEFEANPMLQPDLSAFNYIIGRQLKPEARKDIIEELKEAGIHPTSMIDISDGLASEVLHICNDSKKGCNIYEDKIPIDFETISASDEFDISQITAALNGGEDYELLFTIRQADYEKIKNLKKISVIGHISDANTGVNLVTNVGQSIPITAQGWDGLK